MTTILNPSAARKISRLFMLGTDAITDIWLGIWTLGPIRHRMPDAGSRNVHYEPLRYSAVRALSGRLSCDAQDVVCDIGCGKGRLVCWFARQPVSRVIGIDLDPELTAAAEANLQNLRRRHAMAEIRTEDATASDFDGVTVFVMNNPFGAEVMSAVLESIRMSLTRSPRPIRLAYITPVQAHVVDQADFLEFVEEFPYIYDNSQQSARIYATR